MTGRTGARSALLLLALLVATALLPVAAADHAYSHRYVVYGRVVDAEGDPVPDVVVNMGAEGIDVNPQRDRCVEQPGIETQAFGKTVTRPLTDENGVFLYCFHHHQLSRVEPGTLIFEVGDTGVTKEVTMDPYFRVSFVDIQLPDVREDANKAALDSSYLVVGRLWTPAGGDISVESIRVYGETVDYTPVNVTLELDDGTTQTVNTTTNGYGDFSLLIPVESRVTGGRVIVEADGQRFTQDIRNAYEIHAFKAEFPKEVDPFVANALKVGLGLVALAAVAGGGIYGYRKMQAKRELEHARRTSTRKRAQR